MRHVLAVDLGGTQIRAALVDETGALLHERTRPTGAADGQDAVIGRILDAVAEIRAAAPEIVPEALGVGAPGPLDPIAGVVLTPPNLTGWRNVPLRAILAERSGLPVLLGNDANAAALGEWVFGGGRGLRHLVYVTVSTGIGCGAIVDGRLLLGRRGGAAEVFGMVIDWERGLGWEELACGPALARAALERLPDYPESALHAAALPLTAAAVAGAAASGDPLAVALMEREARLLATGVTNLLTLFSPELLLLGGGVAANNPGLVARVAALVAQQAAPDYRDIPLQVAAFGTRAGLLGAAALGFGYGG